jgi:hypothetical protein
MGLPAVDVSLDKNAGPAPVKSLGQKGVLEYWEGRARLSHPDDVVSRNQSTDGIIEILDATADPSGLHPYIMPEYLAPLMLDDKG